MTVEKEQIEDDYETVKERFYAANEQVSRVQSENDSQVQSLKEDFAQAMETAKFEVQRNYTFELKQLKRCVLHLKAKLVESLDDKAA